MEVAGQEQIETGPGRLTGRRRAPGAFTLIELLVVVAIIAILAAILLPALRAARERALVVACLSRHRQIIIGAILYTNDNEGQFPNTDGSWISRHKIGPYHAQSIGVLLRHSYLPLSRDGVDLAFCPSARDTYNWRGPDHMYRELTTQYGSNNWSQSTMCGKFSTFVGYNTEERPDQADLYLGRGGTGHNAVYISPILTADLVYSPNDPAADPRQGHAGKGICTAFVDGSGKFISVSDVYMVGNAYTGLLGNINPYGNFWLWARAEFGATD